MPIFKIHHITKYEYDRPVKESMNNIMIFPFQSHEQETLQHELLITDKPEVFSSTDYWGNKAGTFNLLRPHRELVIESKLLIRTLAPQDLELLPLSFTKEVDAAIGNDMRLLELVRPSNIRGLDLMLQYVSELNSPEKTISVIVEDTCSFIFNHFTYIKGITNIETTVDEILEKQAGVCQDFAHVMLELLRM
ncbi:MAG: transglutaminase N-terminal domain-containing protein, partial [Sediminibacterium sp.]